MKIKITKIKKKIIILFAIISYNKNIYFCKKIIKEIKNTNNKVFFININKCFIEINKNKKTKIWYGKKIIKKIDILIPRISSNKYNYISLNILKELEKISTITINNYNSIINTNNKFIMLSKLTKKNISIPKTIYINKYINIKKIINKINNPYLIIKTINGCQGKGIYLIKNKKKNIKKIQNILNKEKHILIQQYIKQKYNHDIRYIIFNNKILFCIKRIAKKGEFRSNISQGGIPWDTKKKKKEENMAIEATKKLKLIFSGVDILRDKNNKSFLIEVNSNPGIKSIEKIYKKNITKKILKLIIKYYLSNLINFL